MLKTISLKNEDLFLQIRAMSNKVRFKILELTQGANSLNITELSSALGVAYTKCADYVSILEKQGLIEKIHNGKEVFVKSKVKLEKERLIFTS